MFEEKFEQEFFEGVYQKIKSKMTIEKIRSLGEKQNEKCIEIERRASFSEQFQAYKLTYHCQDMILQQLTVDHILMNLGIWQEQGDYFPENHEVVDFFLKDSFQCTSHRVEECFQAFRQGNYGMMIFFADSSTFNMRSEYDYRIEANSVNLWIECIGEFLKELLNQGIKEKIASGQIKNWQPFITFRSKRMTEYMLEIQKEELNKFLNKKIG